jgi:hypothetical protein
MNKGIYEDGRLWADWPKPKYSSQITELEKIEYFNMLELYHSRPSISVHPDLQKVWEVGKMYKKGKDYEIKWFVKTSSYQGEGGGLFDTEKEAEKKYMEWSKYNGQLQCLTEKPVMQAVPIPAKQTKTINMKEKADYESNTPDKLYSLKLHEEYYPGTSESGWMIKRVAGGWLYIYHRLDQGQMNTVFVPFNNEYQPAD